MKTVYCVLIKIDETLPWLELKGDYATLKEAKQAARQALGKMVFRFVRIPEDRRQLRALITVGAKR